LAAGGGTVKIVVAGFVLGLSSGVAPGPLLTLVVSETLRGGLGAGIRVAVAPLLTDVPIVAFVLFVLANLRTTEPVVGTIAFAGAGYLTWLGIGAIRFRGAEEERVEGTAGSLRRGALTNLLNPNPYVFWLTIGAPLLIRTAEEGVLGPVVFVVVFYSLLVGSKVVIALLVSRSRGVLKSTAYVWANRVLGVILVGFACVFAWEGMAAWGVVPR
jgi:threonine/homoserine/homoserine lactone efflux protein